MIVDKNSILQIFGSLMKHPQYLSESDKYSLTPNDFYYKLHKYIFIAIDNLYQNGAMNIKPIDVENYLSSNGSASVIFKESNGIAYLQDALELSEDKNFEFYYNRLKKINLLNKLDSSGINIDEFYIEDLTKPKALEINSKFEDLDIDDIIEVEKRKILNIEHEFIKNDSTETQSAFNNILNIIENAKEGTDIGIPIQGEIFNEVISGARLGCFVVRSASSGSGKALPNSTIIPTPEGYKRVDEIRIGDYLFDAFGKPTKVLGVYPQGKKEVNFIRFKDGRTSLCCEDHLWSYCTLGQRNNSKQNRKFYTKTLKELKQEKLKNDEGGYNLLVPMNYAVEYPTKNYYIPPYIFGLALGDGSFREHASNKAFQYSSEDGYLPNLIGEAMNWNVKKNSDYNYTWYFSYKNSASNKKNVWVQDFLKDYSKLIGCKSEDKYIPKDYMFGDISQRFDLLNGLLDSDGSTDIKGRVQYFTISPQLRDNVVELCHSLGFKTSVSIDDHKDINIGYVINIIGRPDDKNKLFKLPRKRKLMQEWYDSDNRKELNDFNPIIEIGSCGYTEEMTCFYVDNNEHLFLTSDYIVTHNTRQAVGDACYIAYPFRFEPSKNAWVQHGSCRKVLYIATEQTIPEIQKMILAYLTGFNESKFRYGGFTKKEEQVINQALWLMEKYQDNFYIVQMPNPNIGLIKNIIREQVLLHEIEYVFYDYIFVSASLLSEFKGSALRNDEILLLMSTALKELAVELNIFIMTSTQVNSNSDNSSGIKNESVIAGSRAIVNKADIGVVMSRPTKEELDFFTKSGKEIPNIVTDIYKVRSGEWTQMRIWSYFDYGNLRKVDLFMTDVRMEIVDYYEKRFNYEIDWESTDYNEVIKELENIK